MVDYQATMDGGFEDCKDLFMKLNTRQVIALMFHNEMTDLFDFLGLKGFKRMHEYQYYIESIKHRGLKKYYLSHYGMILPGEHIERIHVIPEDWYKYTKDQVTASVRTQYVQKAMEQYKEWEKGTKELYEKAAATLISWQKIADFNEINCYVKDVDEELKKLERLSIELAEVGYDEVYILSMQDCYHYKYKKKLKEIGKEV